MITSPEQYVTSTDIRMLKHATILHRQYVVKLVCKSIISPKHVTLPHLTMPILIFQGCCSLDSDIQFVTENKEIVMKQLQT